jgi:hypothetical protein
MATPSARREFLRTLIAKPRVVCIHDHLADRPQRDAGELQVRPGERNADESDGEADRSDKMPERQPPAGEHEPDQIAEEAERAGADVVGAEIFGARDGAAAERQERIGGDIEGCPYPASSLWNNP